MDEKHNPSNPRATPKYFMSIFGIGRIYWPGAWNTEDWKRWFNAMRIELGHETAVTLFTYAINGVNDVSNMALPPGMESEQFKAWMRENYMEGKINIIPRNWFERMFDYVPYVVIGGLLIYLSPKIIEAIGKAKALK